MGKCVKLQFVPITKGSFKDPQFLNPDYAASSPRKLHPISLYLHRYPFFLLFS